MKKLGKILLSLSLLFLGGSVAFGGKIRLEPSSGQFISNCPFEVNIMVDTQGVESNTIGVVFYMDDSIFALNELNTQGAMFPAYTSFIRGTARHGDKKGMPTISLMGTTAQKNGFTGKGKYATLKLVSLLGVKSLDFNFYAIPGFSADDSNINYASGNVILDALTEAVGGSYIFVDGECPNYETPVLIKDDAPVILKTKDNGIFFWHQMPFFSKVTKLFVNNITYIIITLLGLLLLLILFKKTKKDALKQNTKPIKK